MARVPTGDSGDWNLDSASNPPLSIKERINRQVSLVSPEQVREMEKEEEFLRTVKPFTTKRFTDRRPPPDRKRLIP